jgi:hypoxanthine-DNA glycosylase
MPARRPAAPARPPQPIDFTATDPLLASFAPVVASDTRVLILGSLPGAASLAASQYYGHPRNNFWRLVGDVIGVALVGMDYETRLSTLLAHRIGLWDVIANARRIGSLDSEIRDPTHNDLLTLVDALPELGTIAFNGGTAAKIGLKALGNRAAEYRILGLPSSSPAHASLSYAQKLVSWLQLTEPGA